MLLCQVYLDKEKGPIAIMQTGLRVGGRTRTSDLDLPREWTTKAGKDHALPSELHPLFIESS